MSTIIVHRHFLNTFECHRDCCPLDAIEQASFEPVEFGYACADPTGNAKATISKLSSGTTDKSGQPHSVLLNRKFCCAPAIPQLARLIEPRGLTCSMSRSGNVLDNAAMTRRAASFRSRRKGQLEIYRDRNYAKADVLNSIECFYKTEPRHSTLGYLTPNEYETKAELA